MKQRFYQMYKNSGTLWMIMTMVLTLPSQSFAQDTPSLGLGQLQQDITEVKDTTSSLLSTITGEKKAEEESAEEGDDNKIVTEKDKEGNILDTVIPVEEKKESTVYEESSIDNWDVPWQQYLGKIKPFKAEEMPAMLELANDQNDAEIQFVLGYMYHFGEGVEQSNDMLAQKWYNKAAKQEHPKSMLALGHFYVNYGNANLATKWLSRASQAGEASAYYKLGEIYEFGFGNIFANPQKAFKNYQKAADAGIEMGLLKVGQFYQWGYGVKADIDMAIAYYQKISDTTKSKKKKQQMDYMISEVFAMVADTKEGKERLSWLEKSANLGNLRSIIRVADIYHAENGKVPQNIPEAIKWFTKATEYGDIYSMVKLGYIYSQGTIEMDPDYCAAHKFYFMAAEKGNADAMYNLGNFYYNGYCVEQDQKQADLWWERMKTAKR